MRFPLAETTPIKHICIEKFEQTQTSNIFVGKAGEASLCGPVRSRTLNMLLIGWQGGFDYLSPEKLEYKNNLETN